MQAGGQAAPEVVALKWRSVRALSAEMIDHDMVEAVYAQPRMRQFFPLVSHGSLQFSRCTEFPWTNDIPALFPSAGGGFVVIRMWEPNGSERQQVGWVKTLEEAAALIVAEIPAGWGPAVHGTADDVY
ncbi:DUF6193 family natural product biosynthesis protein [Streptomyces decoyicus]|uniref:DUF6193 family natural product biosynthesis protein n=1 Tax=Streptomyces decoyicus TaxID=249567 RepID=A0ABZ1FP29_9ACTN|nr:DUF6193 family natural product biosynthesis protein [Streptomyces decoyicus]WSB71650.1 DUF6193 family natural product biosynthesis protein [Streptomyces decoyicus]WSV49458.1 DUF6193 family natural product biosynthesis protein [Streptomyces decoyicus]